MRLKSKIASALCAVIDTLAHPVKNTATAIKNVRRMKNPGRLLAALALTIGILTIVPEAYAAGDCQVMLTVKQVLKGDGLSATGNQTFTYRLTPITAGAPMPVNSSEDGGYRFTMTGSIEAQAGPLIFSSADASTYELRCEADRSAGVTYDQRIYTLEVYVTNDMTYSVVVNNSDGSKVTDIVFEHEIKLLPSDPNDMPNPPVVKTVTGNPSTESTFTFQLLAKDLSNPMPEGSTNGVKTVTISGSGQAVFGTWSYSAEGTYYYTVSEVNSGVRNYVYDGSVYTITDSVSASDGRLVVTRVIANSSNKQVTSYTFINRYTTGGGGGGSTPPTPTPPPIKPPTEPAKPPGHGDAVQPPGDPDGNSDGGIVTKHEPPSGNNPGGNSGGGPKTGDDSRTVLNIVLFVIAGITALGSTAYLLASKRRTATAQ